MNAIKNWWYGWNGPSYKWYKLTRWINVQLANMGWLTGNCAGCGKLTKDFDNYFGWHICNTCSSDEITYNLTEYIVCPSNLFDSVY